MSLTQRDLKSIIRYDPITGLFYHKEKITAENPEGIITHNEKARVKMLALFGGSYTVARIAWLYMTGSFPKEGMLISFRNRDTSDFRWDNLIEVNRSILKINAKPPKPFIRKKHAV